MKFLKNRKTAILITVVTAIIATLIGVYKTSGRDTRDIEAMFYDGVYLKDDGYTQASIDSHLGNSADAALGLATIMEKRPELADKAAALLSARRELIAAESISGKSAAYSGLVSCFDELIRAALSAELTDRESGAAAEYVSTFNGAGKAMLGSGYNKMVMEYLDGRSPFIRIISVFIPVRSPDTFDLPPS